MGIRFVTKTVHAYLDYPVAISLIVVPFVLNLGQTNPWEIRVSVACGLAAFVLTLLTDHKTGVFRVIPYWLHVAVDRMVGLVFIVAPFVFDFSGLASWYYWLNAAAVLIVTTVLNAPEPSGDASTLMRA
jgi:hypothetical protein